MATPTGTEIPKISLELAFQVRIDFKERVYFDGPNGPRAWVPAAGGEVWGPRLEGRVVPYSGADFAGAYGADAHYMLEASDGTPIYINNVGQIRPPEGKSWDPDDRDWGGPNEPWYFRTTPRFDTPVGTHDWLTRTVFVGTAIHYSDPDHTVFTYYAVL